MTHASTKTIVITGAGSGIGRALALECHARGYTVYATGHRLESLSDLQAQGLRTQKLDVNSADDIRALAQRLADDGRAPDLLINNAGFGAIAPMAEIPLEQLRRQFETNVFSIVALCQALIPAMAARRQGCIVNIGSVSGVVTTPFAGAYCASKAAVHALSNALRMELAPLGIKVITVQPGAIRSNFGASAAKQASASLQPQSLYAAVADGIAARAEASQEGAISSEEFARRMMDAVMARRPKPIVCIGKHSTLLPLLQRWLPTLQFDRVLSARFKLDRLRTTA